MATITVRYVRYGIDIAGFRTRHIMVATTLLEAPAKELAQLYLRRWDIELCFDDIKTTMAMDFIRAKSPAMAVKMLTLYAIACNLVRLLMQQAVRTTGSPPARVSSMRLSFKGALDATCASPPKWHRFPASDGAACEKNCSEPSPPTPYAGEANASNPESLSDDQNPSADDPAARSFEAANPL